MLPHVFIGAFDFPAEKRPAKPGAAHIPARKNRLIAVLRDIGTHHILQFLHPIGALHFLRDSLQLIALVDNVDVRIEHPLRHPILQVFHPERPVDIRIVELMMQNNVFHGKCAIRPWSWSV